MLMHEVFAGDPAWPESKCNHVINRASAWLQPRDSVHDIFQPSAMIEHQPLRPKKQTGPHWEFSHCKLGKLYSQVHKYWDIDTILIFLALYTTTMDLKLNKLQTFSFNLRVYTSKSGERCRSYNSFYMCLPLFKGPKVMGQLAAQLFHGQVCDIPSLSHLQGTDKRSRVHFKCAICIWNLLLSTLNMRSKEL